MTSALSAPDPHSVLHALGDPTRRTLIEAVTERPMSVSSLAERLGVTLTAVGQHVQVLEDAGLVTSHKSGRVRSVQLATAGFRVLEQWISDRRSPLEQSLDRLGNLLDEG